MQQSIDIAYLPGPQQQTCCSERMGHTDGQTPHRFVDPALHTMRAVPIMTMLAMTTITNTQSLYNKPSFQQLLVIYAKLSLPKENLSQFSACFVTSVFTPQSWGRLEAYWCLPWSWTQAGLDTNHFCNLCNCYIYFFHIKRTQWHHWPHPKIVVASALRLNLDAAMRHRAALPRASNAWV